MKSHSEESPHIYPLSAWFRQLSRLHLSSHFVVITHFFRLLQKNANIYSHFSPPLFCTKCANYIPSLVYLLLNHLMTMLDVLELCLWAQRATSFSPTVVRCSLHSQTTL